MHTSSFFKLFPPPRFLLMKHAGLDISDDAIHSISYIFSTTAGTKLGSYAHVDLPPGIIDGGDIRDEKTLVEILTKYREENNLYYVKVSWPEEKAYLFQTDIPSLDAKSVVQNIEFKLEENVPLSATDAVFYYDILPGSVRGGVSRASVSVAPRIYVEKYISILRQAGMVPVAFEVVPKAIAHAILPSGVDKTFMIVFAMNSKTGIYIVSGGVVCFTSTVGIGTDATQISKELNRIYLYWASHQSRRPSISEVILAGRNIALLLSSLEHAVEGVNIPFSMANTWYNVFDLNHYIPTISHDDSLEFVVAAGLALNS